MSVSDSELFDSCAVPRDLRLPHVRHGQRVGSRAVGRLCRHAPVLSVLMEFALAFAVARLWGNGPAVSASLAGGLAAVVAVHSARRRELAPSVLPVVRPAVLGAVVGFAAAALFSGGAEVQRLAGAAVAAVPVVLGVRLVTSSLVRRARRRGHDLQPTLIVGAGGIGASIARVLRHRPEFGLSPVGFIDDPDEDAGLPLPVLGPSASLAAVVRRHGVTRVVIAYGSERELELVRVLRASAELDAQVYVLPRFFELGSLADGRVTDDLWGFPLVPLRRPGSRRSVWRAKRAFDLVVGAGLLLMTAPVMAVAAVAVRLSSPGPVLFRQERIGLGGETYELLKFRSMRVNDDGDRQWSVDDDDRVTRVGQVLRRSHLDELPQLWNVLRGDMSLVGPRPERPTFVDRFSEDVPGYRYRHRVPTGLTGLAQVNGLWGDTSIEERARFDNLYIEQWSVVRDLEILLRTVPTLLGRQEDAAGAPPADTPVPPSAADGSEAA